MQRSMNGGPLPTRLYICNWVAADVAYGKKHVSAMTKTSTDAGSIIQFSDHVWYVTVVWITLIYATTLCTILHIDIVAYCMYTVLVLVMHLSVYTIKHHESRFNVN